VSKTVSIILPTYNRADTIVRAIESVQAQTFQDWELIVVDDGSTDGTAELIANLEPRMTLIRQENRGFTEARNVGIRASTGEYLAFLDSDDEFMPHHLELCVAFLEAHPDEQFVSTELIENFGHGRFVRHYRIETAEWFPQRARQVRSHMLDLPEGESDSYLRVYKSRERIDDWGCGIVERVGGGAETYLYRGSIFEYLRWGFLITITATVMRRTALEIVGLPQTRLSTGSDFHFMASLCRNFNANYLSIPTFIKHELNSEGKDLALSHVVTGASSLRFHKDLLHAWDELFWDDRPHENELTRLRGSMLFQTGVVALEAGERDEALRFLEEARTSRKGYWRAIALAGFIKCLPGPTASRQAWAALTRGSAACQELFRGQLTLWAFLRKAMTRIGVSRHKDS
jgi:glycosyltransferase involved in cell wall biosynthesis